MEIRCKCGTKLRVSGLKDGMKLTCHQCGRALSVRARKKAQRVVPEDGAGLDALALSELEAEDSPDSNENVAPLLRRSRFGAAPAGKKKRGLRFREGFFKSIWEGIRARIGRAVERPATVLREFGLPLILLALTGAGGWCWTVVRDNRAARAKVYDSFADYLGERARGNSKELTEQPYARANMVVLEQRGDRYRICENYTPPVLDPKKVGALIRIRWLETKEPLTDSYGRPLTVGLASNKPIALTIVHAELDLVDMVSMKIISLKELRPQVPEFEADESLLTHPPFVKTSRGLVLRQVDEWLSLPIKE